MTIPNVSNSKNKNDFILEYLYIEEPMPFIEMPFEKGEAKEDDGKQGVFVIDILGDEE